ncbi:hypothetical protein D3C78_1975790 [compost metagenome]
MATCWVMISRLDTVRKLGTMLLKNSTTSSKAIKVRACSKYMYNRYLVCILLSLSMTG